MHHFTLHNLPDATVVEFITPSLMDSLELERITAELMQLIDQQDCRRMILDFEKVQYLSSQAISMLLSLQKRLSSLDKGALILCGVGSRLLELLRITRLDKILTIRPTRKEALDLIATPVE